MDSIADRLKQLMDDLDLNPANFADEIRVQRSGISHILSGRNKPSLEFIEKLSKRYPKADLRWLITGRSSESSLERNIEDGIEQEDKGKSDTSASANNKSTKIILLKNNNTFEEYFPAE